MVKFVKMIEQEFIDYLDFLIEEISKDYVQAKGVNMEEAQLQSQSEIKGLLPEGLGTPDVFIGFIRNMDQNIGQIWYIHEHKKQYTFLADIEIFPEYQKKGFGTQALSLLEKEVRKLKK